MQKFDENLYREKYKICTNRLLNVNYSNLGFYFITICTQNRLNYFGQIIDDRMVLNHYGKIVHEQLQLTEQIRPYIKMDTFVVMPNHIHFVLEITDLNGRDAINRVSTDRVNGGVTGKHNCMLNKTSLGYIVRSFKSACTKQIHDFGLLYFAWQSNYYEHIIYNDESLYNIREYIINNPRNWNIDRNNFRIIYAIK